MRQIRSHPARGLAGPAGITRAVLGSTGVMDAITLLKEDHKTVEGLFTKFEQAGDRAVKAKRQLVDQMIKELTTHAYIEETLFYPAARKAVPDTTDHVLESIEEHHVVAKGARQAHRSPCRGVVTRQVRLRRTQCDNYGWSSQVRTHHCDNRQHVGTPPRGL